MKKVSKAMAAKKPMMKKGGAVSKPLAKKQKGGPKTYNQLLLKNFPNKPASDTLPENTGFRFVYAPSAYDAAKNKVDRENEFNDESGESRVRSKKELDAMNKTINSYKKRGGTVKPKAKLGAIVKSKIKPLAKKK